MLARTDQGVSNAFELLFWAFCLGLLALVRVLGPLLLLGLLVWALCSCVEVVENERDVTWADSGQVARLSIDSLAIYRCDNCPFAKRYQRATRSLVKSCKSCPWQAVPPKTHDRGRVPHLENPAVEAIAEKHPLPVERFEQQARRQYVQDSTHLAHRQPQTTAFP
ncbi:hypothetical protein [Spirosoma sordidisoli]|uniref:Uncharacterized protein n=1 Tax=Spirosoma sordidisoli TaxID=2502893 RepID=A0A4Q2UGF2_9BACT|nr:hypothetical protein [Spirosoma sordidisoli]RYC66340.1 hypothetical protein EQG79_30160 [Spirosoma sordidisoli]